LEKNITFTENIIKELTPNNIKLFSHKITVPIRLENSSFGLLINLLANITIRPTRNLVLKV
jgi:hypothetical protein